MDVPQRYHTMPSYVTGLPANVDEAYARFAQGPGAADTVPDFAEAVKHHRLLDQIARAAATGNRTRL